jgi:TonB family protein
MTRIGHLGALIGPRSKGLLWRTPGFRTSIYPMRLRRLVFPILAISWAAMSVQLGAQGTGCAETKYPPELPQPGALVAGPTPMVFSVVFQHGDSVSHVRALDKNDAAAAVSLANYVRHAPPRELWAFRVRISGGDAPALTLERSTYCPPVSREGDLPFATKASMTASVVVEGGPLPPYRPGSGITFDPNDVVPVEVLISADGRVILGRVLQSLGSPERDARMVHAMKSVKFQPAKLDGQPIQAVYRSRGESPRP